MKAKKVSTGKCGHCGAPVHYMSTYSMGMWVHTNGLDNCHKLTQHQLVKRD